MSAPPTTDAEISDPPMPVPPPAPTIAPTTVPASAPRGVIPSLDGFRFLAVLVVFLGHVGLSSRIPGGFGVTVFFFLSGYLITTLLTREHDRHGRIAFGAFFARRAVRLLPPLLVTLAAAAVLAWFGLVRGDLDPRTFASQILFYYNYYAIYGDAGTSVGGFALLWSLSVEEHFYLIWPALFLFFARDRLRISHLLALLVAILAWRGYRFLAWGDSEWVIYSLTDTRFDSLLYGCLLALLEWRGQARRLFPASTGAALALCGLGLAVILASFLWRDALFRSTLRYSLQGIALMPIFHYAVSRADSPLARRCALVGRVVDLAMPEVDEVQVPGAAPGMDPSRPPRLK